MPTSHEKRLLAAMAAIKKLKIPEHMQDTALKFILQGPSDESNNEPIISGYEPEIQSDGQIKGNKVQHLRQFIAGKNPKGAVEEIPCLVYWAREYDNLDRFNEDDVRQLYHSAHIKPPKNIGQSLRDLSSKSRKYMRVEPAGGNTGYFKLSHGGEVFVEFDVAGGKEHK